MSKYLFVKYNDNWADEMDITGFAIVKQEDWAAIIEEVKAFFKKKLGGWTFGVGTNEEIEYMTFKDWSRQLSQTELSDDEAKTMIDVFKRAKIRPGYDEPRLVIEEGFFPLPSSDEVDEADDDYDEDDEDGEDDDLL
jgi:hypothetical protein